MNESKARIWKKISCFYGLTMIFSGVFDAFVIHAGKMDTGGLIYVTGSMWSPALAAFATKRMFGESVRELPWKWGNARNAWLGYLIPIAYALPVYLIVWITGLGAFASDSPENSTNRSLAQSSAKSTDRRHRRLAKTSRSLRESAVTGVNRRSVRSRQTSLPLRPAF
jgi:hypothetical protein